MSVRPPSATNTSTAPIAIWIVTTCFVCSNRLIRWAHWLDFRLDCTSLSLRRRHQDCPSWSRLRVSRSTVPIVVRLVLQVCALPPKKMCLRLFQTLLCQHDVHDFLRLAVGVVWCFDSNCEVPSVGRALTWYHSASVSCVCERTIRAETDPLSLSCHGFDRHQGSSHLGMSRFNGHWLVFCIFGHN